GERPQPLDLAAWARSLPGPRSGPSRLRAQAPQHRLDFRGGRRALPAEAWIAAQRFEIEEQLGATLTEQKMILEPGRLGRRQLPVVIRRQLVRRGMGIARFEADARQDARERLFHLSPGVVHESVSSVDPRTATSK